MKGSRIVYEGIGDKLQGYEAGQAQATGSSHSTMLEHIAAQLGYQSQGYSATQAQAAQLGDAGQRHNLRSLAPGADFLSNSVC